MVLYVNLVKGSLEYVRNLLRADQQLMVTILGLSGTTSAVNHVFVGRPADEKVNVIDNRPNFQLPRIVVDYIVSSRGKKGDNEDGENESFVDMQISCWTSSRKWSLAFDAHDRIANLLENDNMTLTSGWAKFKVFSGDIIDDPDRMQTKLGTIRVKNIIKGG